MVAPAKQTRSARHTRHGHAQRVDRPASRTYTAWARMLQRCTNPRVDTHAHYGGRGITVCRRWRKFEAFLLDMGPVPVGKTLDRRDNSKGYNPSNCRWATRSEQARNKRTTKLTAKKAAQIRWLSTSKIMSVSGIARRYKISRKMVREIRDGKQWT